MKEEFDRWKWSLVRVEQSPRARPGRACGGAAPGAVRGAGAAAPELSEALHGRAGPVIGAGGRLGEARQSRSGAPQCQPCPSPSVSTGLLSSRVLR